MAQMSHKSWLKVTAVVIASFGPVFFLSTMVETAAPSRITLDILSWPLPTLHSFEAQTTRFLSALTGGFLFGWGIMVWALSGDAYDAAPEAVRKAVLTGLIAWFCLDSAGSVASGTWPNVVFNIIVLIIGVGPMWRPEDKSRMQEA